MSGKQMVNVSEGGAGLIITIFFDQIGQREDYIFLLALASFMVMILPGCSGSHIAAPPCLK